MNNEAKIDDLKLSVLDLATVYNGESAHQTLKNSTELVQLADRLGYTRYWFAEHHNAPYQMSTSPDLLSAHAGAVTERIRIGSGGIMVPNHSPLKVVENFSILEALYPGRVDLGMGRASGTNPVTQMALRNSSEPLTAQGVMRQIQEILLFFERGFPDDHPYESIQPSPDAALRPDLFMLGSSDGGMQIAAELGVGFVFAGQINPDQAVPMLQAYREHFKPSIYFKEPYSMLAIIVVCAETNEEAERISLPAQLQWARWQTGEFKKGPPSQEEAEQHEFSKHERQATDANKGRFVIGDPESVKEQLLQLQKDAQVNEVMAMNMIPDKAARNRSYELLADAFSLPKS